jgi:hypothetical protein
MNESLPFVFFLHQIKIYLYLIEDGAPIFNHIKIMVSFNSLKLVK